MTRGQKILLGIGLLVLVWIISAPLDAAEVASDLLANLKEAANALITFLTTLFA